MMADAAKGSMESLSSWWKVAALGTMAAQNSGGRCPKPVVRTPTHRWREPDSNRQYRPSVPCDTTHFSRGLMSALLDPASGKDDANDRRRPPRHRGSSAGRIAI